MNLLREGVTLSNTKTEQKEMDFNLSNEKQTQFIKAPQDNFIIPRKSGENINFFNNYFSNQQGCDIMSYYYTTQKYFLNSEEDLKIFSFKKESRNFIKKTKLNDFYRKENKNNYNYNGDYINNLDKLNIIIFLVIICIYVITLPLNHKILFIIIKVFLLIIMTKKIRQIIFVIYPS